MKFENIKVGDEVLTPKYINLGWRTKKSFNCIEKVSKITKTQFTTESGKRFKKDDGKQIGDNQYYSYCHFLGETIYGNPLKDETHDYIEFNQKLMVYRSVKNELESIVLNLDIELSDMTSIHDKVMEIKKINNTSE